MYVYVIECVHTCVRGVGRVYVVLMRANVCVCVWGGAEVLKGSRQKSKNARGFGSVVKHSTADPGIASSIPPHSN